MTIKQIQVGFLSLGCLKLTDSDFKYNLHPSEWSLAEKFKHPLRKKEFLTGRHILHTLNSKLPPVLSTDSGMPLWSGGYTGSISHKNGWVMGVSTNQFRSLGIDLEDSSQFPIEVKSDISHPDELQILPRFENIQEHLSLIFSCKESLFKACYPLCKVWFGFHDARLLSYKEGVFEIELLKTLSKDFHKGKIFQGHYKTVKWETHTFVITSLCIA